MNLDDLFRRLGQPLTLDKNEYVFRQGDAHEYVYFIEKGLLKAFYVSSAGKEAIKSFLLPGDIIGSLSAAVRRDVCTFNLICLKDSKLLRLPFAAVIEAGKASMETSANLIDMLLALAMKKERREYEFLALSAQERYLALCEHSPEILQQVTQNDIAHYLGITPVALSRIKNRIKGEGA